LPGHLQFEGRFGMWTDMDGRTYRQGGHRLAAEETNGRYQCQRAVATRLSATGIPMSGIPQLPRPRSRSERPLHVRGLQVPGSFCEGRNPPIWEIQNVCSLRRPHAPFEGQRCAKRGRAALRNQGPFMSSRTPVDRSPALPESTVARLRTNRTRSNRRPSASTEFCIQHIRRNIGRSPWTSLRMLDAHRQDR
jgi:hypothetical protein